MISMVEMDLAITRIVRKACTEYCKFITVMAILLAKVSDLSCTSTGQENTKEKQCRWKEVGAGKDPLQSCRSHNRS
jgi:hypothetical protein